MTTQAKRARALVKLTAAQCELRAFALALPAIREAVDLYRSLARVRADPFQSELAGALEQWSEVLGHVGQPEPALVAAMEAMDAYRGLAKTHPEKYLPRVAMGLNGLSVRLRDLGRHAEALPLAQSALEWLWPYYERFPDVHRKQISTMFSVLVGLHEDLGSRLDATWAKRFEQVAAQVTGEPKGAPATKATKGGRKRK